MKLVGELKKQVEETKNKEEAKELIENAGMELTDEELDCVTGGYEESVNTGDGSDLFHSKGIVNGRFDGDGGNGMLDNDDEGPCISVDAGDGFGLRTLFGNKFNKFGN